MESADSTVAELKNAIETKVGIPQAQQRLIYKGKVMNKEENTLESYGIGEGDTVHMAKVRWQLVLQPHLGLAQQLLPPRQHQVLVL